MGQSKSAPSLTRRLVTLALLSAGTASRVRAAPCGRPPNVLFVCPAGTVKSAIARETLKARAAAAGIKVHATSRGIDPADHVTPALAASLRADGINPRAEPLQRLAGGDVAAADIIIAFDEAVQAPGLKGARSWDIPSWNTDYPSAKAALASRVDGLLTELKGREAGCSNGQR